MHEGEKAAALVGSAEGGEILPIIHGAASRWAKDGAGSWSRALFCGVAVATMALAAIPGAAAPGFAQDETEADEEEEGDTIVVVGSRLRRNNFSTSSPIQLITKDESVQAGFAATLEALQMSSATGGTAQINNLFGGFVVDGGGGVNTVALRGFGPTSTLVLVNGRRLTPAGTRGAVGAADLNTLPSALVDHIEVLKDGASSIYGSDAVAGVINIVTEQGIDDFTFEAQHNFVEQGGGEQTRISLTGGRVFDRLSLGGAVEYYERDAITRGDRDWALCNRQLLTDPTTGESTDYIDPFTGEFKCYTTGLTGENGVTINTIGTANRAGVGALGSATPGATGTFNRWRPASNITTGLPGFEGVGGTSAPNINVRDTFEPRQLNSDIVSGGENWNVFLQGTYDLDVLGDADVYGEILWSGRTSVQVGYRQLSLDYPANSPLLPANLRNIGNFSAASTYPNPPPTNVTLPAPYATGVRGFIGFGNYDTSQDVDYNRFVAGMRGDLFLPDWHYDVNVSYGKNEGEYVFESWLTDRLFNSLVVTPAPAGTPANLVRNVDGVNYMCAITATTPDYGCVPAPFLSNQVIAGQAFPQDWVDWTFVDVVGVSEYSEAAFSAVVDGPLFDLPGGEALGAFGVEYRDAEIDDSPDFNSVNNNLYNLTAATPTRGKDNVAEAFAEVELPLISGLPLADSLTANVSLRYTDYESYGSDTTHKLGLLYRPIEGLALRGTQGTSYRAPALYEQFLGPTTGFQAASQDPCHQYGSLNPATNRYQNCNAEIGDTTFLQTSGVTVLGAGGAAQGLSAETSDNYTVGVLVEPGAWLDDAWGDLQLSVDYFSIHVDNQVTRVGFANLRSLCYDSANFATDPYCSYFSRDSLNRLTVFDSFTNISQQEAYGFDYTVRYEKEIFTGNLLLNLNVTQYKEQSFQVLPNTDSTDANGWIENPEYVGDFAATYETGPWLFRWGTTYTSLMSDYERRDEDPFFIDLKTPEYYLHNTSVQYTQPDGAWQITAGVRNIEDTEPPIISAGYNNRVGNSPLYSGFDYFGRQYFVNLSTKF